jgi:hypothetical protein
MWRITDSGTLKDRENLTEAYAELHWDEPLGRYQVKFFL